MKKCPECNNLVEDNLRECSNCGYPFNGTEEDFEKESSVIADTEVASTEEKTVKVDQDQEIEQSEVKENTTTNDVVVSASNGVEPNIDSELQKPLETAGQLLTDNIAVTEGEKESQSKANGGAFQMEPTEVIKEKKIKLDKRSIVEIAGSVILVISLICSVNFNAKYHEYKNKYEEVTQELETMTQQHSNLEDENGKLTATVSELNGKIDELENGASSQLVTIKNAYEKGEWQNVIDLATKLHEKYNGSEEDKQAQEMAKNSQAKIDEATAAKAAEEAKGYETGVTYDQLARTPDDFMGKKVKFYGKVVQVIEGGDSVQIRLAVNDNYDTILLGEYSSDTVTSRVLEDDYITIYGTSVGTISYKSTMGGTITIPGVYIDKIDQ